LELVVFDLDGTLLNRESRISSYTSDTLKQLSDRGIAYTVATGRTLHGARAILEGHGFDLPQAYKNGVTIWHPDEERLAGGAILTSDEVQIVVNACIEQEVTPFVYTLDDHHGGTIYHPPIRSAAEKQLLRSFEMETPNAVHDLDELSEDDSITHINAIGHDPAIREVVRSVRDEPHLVAYSGVALEGTAWRWLDVHHSDASKGGAIKTLKELLGIEQVICFGDSDNDLSMFETADECYAPDNANDRIKSAATEVIGHHDDEGIARFLRKRFELD
jgi:Cof subfamily protein (haloacid dehalogenase superfamily)